MQLRGRNDFSWQELFVFCWSGLIVLSMTYIFFIRTLINRVVSNNAEPQISSRDNPLYGNFLETKHTYPDSDCTDDEKNSDSPSTNPRETLYNPSTQQPYPKEFTRYNTQNKLKFIE